MVEIRDSAKCPTRHRTAPHNIELFGSNVIVVRIEQDEGLPPWPNGCNNRINMFLPKVLRRLGTSANGIHVRTQTRSPVTESELY